MSQGQTVISKGLGYLGKLDRASPLDATGKLSNTRAPQVCMALSFASFHKFLPPHDTWTIHRHILRASPKPSLSKTAYSSTHFYREPQLLCSGTCTGVNRLVLGYREGSLKCLRDWRHHLSAQSRY